MAHDAITNRLVVVPAWGTSSGPWKSIRDAWPGPTETFVGAGLLDQPVPADWSMELDISSLASVVQESDLLCGAGWAASTALRAAERSRPRAVVLYSPPLGVDFSKAAAEIRTADDARKIMSGFGGTPDYWIQAEQAPNFVSRVQAYLSQDVETSGQSVACPIIVIWPAAAHSHTPPGWRVIVCEPAEAPARVLSTLNQ